ncbi:hypothetical protein GYB22_13380 [bacterium]|nr:hypothetical protein [bacterium]
MRNYQLGYVPLSVLEYYLKSKKTNLLSLYLYLKYYSKNGFIVLTKGDYSQIGTDLDYSKRTIDRLLKLLTEEDLLGSPRRNVYYIRSYKFIINKLKLSKSQRVELLLPDLKKSRFKLYCTGAVVGCIAKNMTYARRYGRGRKSERSKRSLIFLKSPSSMSPLSYRFLENSLNMPRSTIARLINESSNLGYIAIVHKTDSTDYSPSEIKYIKECSLEPGTFPVVRKGKVYLKLPSYVGSTLHYKKHVNRTKPGQSKPKVYEVTTGSSVVMDESDIVF